MLPARTYSVSIRHEWRALYERIWRPEFFAQWAAGLADSELSQEGDGYVAHGADDPIRICFTPHNDFGVMDHFVGTGNSAVIHVPLRVVANGSGAEVMLTLYRQLAMTDEGYSSDVRLVNRDLRALKSLVER